MNLAVAVGFAVMGAFVIYLANTGRMTGGPGFQVALGNGLTRVFAWVEHVTAGVPEPVLGLAVLGFAAVLVLAALRDRRRPSLPEREGAASCHAIDVPTERKADPS